MANRFFTFLLLLLCSAPAFSQYVTVHAKLTDPSGSVPASAFLHFALQNCGDNFPNVTGLNIVMGVTSFDLKPTQTDGSILGQVIGNDQILCGNVASTYYQVTPMQNQTTPLGAPENFVICSSTSGPISPCYPGSGTWEFAQAQPMTDPPGVPGFTFILGNPTQAQSITQPGAGSGAAIGVTCCTTGAVTALTLQSPGISYMSPPALAFSGGGCTVEPTAIATVMNGGVNSVTLTGGGSGCTSTPSIFILGGGSSLAINGTLDLTNAIVVGLFCNFTGCGGGGGGGGGSIFPIPPQGALQFYQSGNLGGSPNLVWDSTLNQLTVGAAGGPKGGILCLPDPLALSGGSCLSMGPQATSGTSVLSQLLSFTALNSGGNPVSGSMYLDAADLFHLTVTPIIPTPSTGDTSTKAVNSQWVRNQNYCSGTCGTSVTGSIGSAAASVSVSPGNTLPMFITSFTLAPGQLNTANKSFFVDSGGSIIVPTGTTAVSVGLCINDGTGIQLMGVVPAVNNPATTMSWSMHAGAGVIGSGPTNILLSSGMVGFDSTGTGALTMYPVRTSGTFNTTAALTIGPCVRFASVASSPSATAQNTTAFETR